MQAMKRANLRLICRPDKLRAVEEKLTSNCQAFGITLLKRNSQEYWKDKRCAEVNYEFSSSISLEQWYLFFSDVFGTDNNTVEEGGREITHAASPILNDTEEFAHLFIDKQDAKAHS